MLRLQLRRGGGLAIEAALDGRQQLIELRRNRPDMFANGRIREILQLGYMPLGTVYEINGRQLGEPGP